MYSFNYIIFPSPNSVIKPKPRLPQTFTWVIDHHAGITHQPLDVRSQLRPGGAAEQSLVIFPEVTTSHHLP